MQPRIFAVVWAVVLALVTAGSAFGGDAEEVGRCAAAIHSGIKAVVQVGGARFTCSSGVVVSTDPTRRGWPSFGGDHAYFEGYFTHLNATATNDVVRFFTTVRNWKVPERCAIAPPLMRIERNGRLTYLSEWASNTWDWKRIPQTIDGPWELSASWISAAATARWHESSEFAKCRRDGW